MPRPKRTYGVLEISRARIKEEIMEAKWSSLSTVQLIYRYYGIAGFTKKQIEAKYFTRDPVIGDHDNQGAYYHVQNYLKNLGFSIVLDDGTRVRLRSIANVKNGKPLNRKRAQDPDAHGLEGIWIPFKALRKDQMSRIRDYYIGRERDSQLMKMVTRVAGEVLRPHDDSTSIGNVWEEFVQELNKSNSSSVGKPNESDESDEEDESDETTE
jgi:hypothetical protein